MREFLCSNKLRISIVTLVSQKKKKKKCIVTLEHSDQFPQHILNLLGHVATPNVKQIK